MKLHRDHGISFTIKWLKAGYVAIQKELGQNGLKTLRDINPDLPLPALAGRLPRIIPVADRALIRSGNATVIRFWSSLFNLYRIFKCPGDIKISTITAPFSGNAEGLAILESNVNNMNPFRFLKIWKGLKEANLSPTKFEISRRASPTNSLSAHGLLTDIFLMYERRRDLYEALHHMAFATFPVQTAFMQLIADGYDIISDLELFVTKTSSNSSVIGKDNREYSFPRWTSLSEKASVATHGYGGSDGGFAQFAIKEEAAGKVRVFALLDSLSQTFLRPLHDKLFDVLRQIPNDGTFDQDASVTRCQGKAIDHGCAFSFDLTAATDRIPATLSAKVIEALFQNDLLGQFWLKVMTDRNFYFNSKVAEKYKVSPGPYRYSVGQPMGGLSSWAMLALTHHWTVQYAAYLAGTNLNNSWYTAYEILGDDLVIFDPLTADKYLEVMNTIGCEINLNKSIISRNRPVFEFAKRTCWGTEIVSGISFNQLGANYTIGNRVANVLSFGKLGLIGSSSILLSLLTRDCLANVSALKSKVTSVSLLALLGSLYHSGKVSLIELVTALIHPKDGFHGDIIDIPRAAVLKLAYTRLVEPDDKTSVKPWSHWAEREDVFLEHEDFFTVQVLQKAVLSAEALLANWKSYVLTTTSLLIHPMKPVGAEYSEENLFDYLHFLPDEYVILIDKLTDWTGTVLGVGISVPDPAELLEEATDKLVQFQYDSEEKLSEALKFHDMVDGVKDSLLIVERPEDKEFVAETSQSIELVKSLVGINRLKVPKSLQPN
jgi:hypothetical protein